jgi:hypothetical protein
VATEIMLTAWAHRWFSTPVLLKINPAWHHIASLAYTMVFVGSIWKNKSGWFLFVMSPGLSVATEIVLATGVHPWFSTQVLLKINPVLHHQSNESLPCPYDGVCWIHLE